MPEQNSDGGNAPGSLPAVIILAGGLGTRLGHLTAAAPKSMVSINGEPFASRQLKLLARQGFREVIFCVGMFAEQIQEFVGDGRQFGLQVKYSLDGDELLGTGGAIAKALPLVSKEFAIIYGDSYLDVDAKSIYASFKKASRPGLMTVYKNNNQIERSNTLMQDGKIIAYEKKEKVPGMEHVDYGLSFFSKAAFDSFRDQRKFDLGQLFQRLISEGQMSGYEVPERYHEIGSVVGISDLEKYLDNKGQ